MSASWWGAISGYLQLAYITQSLSTICDFFLSCTATRCVPVPTIEYATPDRTSPTDFGTQIAYTCDPGYKFSDGTYDPKNATCLDTGDWNKTGLTCTGYSPCITDKMMSAFQLINFNKMEAPG